MTKKISAFALMACLATSFAFAAESNKRASADATKTDTAQTATTASTEQDGCPTNNKKNQKNAKTAPSTQEQEFDKVLQGIHG